MTESAAAEQLSDCEKAKRDLEEFLRNEICVGEAQDIRDHIAQCAECADEHRVQVVLKEVVQRACNKEAAPESLRDQLIARIREMQASHAGE